MKKIRKGIFETNSSSSHSIHIDSDMELMDYSLIPNENGEVNIFAGEFGSGPDRLGTAYEKLSYCYTAKCNEYILEKLIKEMTGATVVNFHDSEYSYVEDNAVDNISDDEQSLKELIFNRRSVIYVEYDGGRNPPEFYCDKTIGKYKMTMLNIGQYREMNINIITENDDKLEIGEDKWIYMFNNDKMNIVEACERFMDHINDTYTSKSHITGSGTCKEFESFDEDTMTTKIKVFLRDGDWVYNNNNTTYETYKVIVEKI